MQVAEQRITSFSLRTRELEGTFQRLLLVRAEARVIIALVQLLKRAIYGTRYEGPDDAQGKERG